MGTIAEGEKGGRVATLWVFIFSRAGADEWMVMNGSCPLSLIFIESLEKEEGEILSRANL